MHHRPIYVLGEEKKRKKKGRRDEDDEDEEYLDIPQPRGSDTTNFLTRKCASRPENDQLKHALYMGGKQQVESIHVELCDTPFVNFLRTRHGERRRFVLLCLRASAGILYVCSRELDRVREKE